MSILFTCNRNKHKRIIYGRETIAYFLFLLFFLSFFLSAGVVTLFRDSIQTSTTPVNFHSIFLFISLSLLFEAVNLLSYYFILFYISLHPSLLCFASTKCHGRRREFEDDRNLNSSQSIPLSSSLCRFINT